MDVPPEEYLSSSVRIPLRDGIELAVDYFLPSASVPFPTLVELTPYGRGEKAPNFRNEVGYWIRNDYAFVIAESRGTGDSGGEMTFLAREGQDGYDLIEWIAQQPWSNGRIGMRGASYSGWNQWYVAREQPPHLLCITPTESGARPMMEVPYANGAFTVAWGINWIGSLNLSSSLRKPIAIESEKWLKHRPLQTLDVYVTGHELRLYRDFLEHPTYDGFWRSIDFLPSDFQRIQIPSLAFTGWFDGTMTGTISHFQEAQNSALLHNDHFLIVGPYMHSTATDGGDDRLTGQFVSMVGDVSIPNYARLPAQNMTRLFFDWCLKNQSRPQWDPVKLFITGINRWVTYATFPPPEAQDHFLFLTRKHLQWDLPSKSTSDHYQYDPLNPLIIDIINRTYDRPIDISHLLGRQDMLIHTSAKLNDSLTVIGDVILELYVSSSVPDTDIVVQLMDVYPDGRSIKLGSKFSHQLRLRYRDGYDREVFMTPDTIYFVRIEMNAIGHTFLPGHQIRLAITSSFYPWLSANPNTGGLIATDTQPPGCSKSHILLFT